MPQNKKCVKVSILWLLVSSANIKDVIFAVMFQSSCWNFHSASCNLMKNL